MTKLVIVESPTKAKTLSGILGKSYTIKASMGHIRDLPKSGLGIDVDNNYEPMYEVPEKAKKTVADLKALALESDEIVLATDPDREGEAIAWHLQFLLTEKPKAKKSKKTKAKVTDEPESVKDKPENFQRVFFHELTKNAVLDAFAHPQKLNLDLVDAQQARRVLDRLVGYKLSPLLWKKVRYGLSAGRVQSVAVRLVVERERERQKFVPVEYWSIDGNFHADNKRKVKAELAEYAGKKLEIHSEAESLKLKNELEKDTYTIASVKKSERQRKPYAPFKTSTLQQSAANVFGFPAKKTMQAAQKLFEEGYITYHRTDSLNLSPQFTAYVRNYIEQKIGKKYLPDEPIFYKTNAKNAQEAHEAIRVTTPELEPNMLTTRGLTIEEHKVYSLIWKRSLECQMLSAIYDQTSLAIGSSKGYVFKTSGSVVKFEGWLAVGSYIGVEEDPEEMNKLPEFVEGESMTLDNLDAEQHFTQPPARYSDATLIKSLEELGIGRPSTYAPTITTITTRGYVVKEGKYFVPQDVAYVVTDLLVKYFEDIVNYKFTADMEEKLDSIANGESKWIPVIDEFYKPFEQEVKLRDTELKKVDVTTLEVTDEKCPDCGKQLVIKLGKYGKFLSCSGYPDCKYAKPLDTGEAEAEGIDYGKCPNCEDGIFKLKRGKFGKFLACSNYPKCKTTQPFLEKIGMKCPKCTDGEVIIKKYKGRVFYGCSRYPDCDYSSWKNPLKSDEKTGDTNGENTENSETSETK